MHRFPLLLFAAAAACAPMGSFEADLQSAQWEEGLAVFGSLACPSGDVHCHSASAHRAATARQTQTLLHTERRQAARHQQQQALLYRVHKSQTNAGSQGFWCFEGQHSGDTFGQCHPNRESCLMLMGRRIESGMVDAADCDRHEQAACFLVTRSLKDGHKRYCFPTTEQCDDWQDDAAARDFETVTDCSVAN